MSRWCCRAAVATAVFAVAVTVRADAPPATEQAVPPPEERGQPMASPYWNNGGNGPLGDLPAADIRNVVTARANKARTFWTFQQAQMDLNNAVRLTGLQMDRDPNYQKAVAEEKEAYEALQAARAKALADLQNNASYVAAEELRQHVSGQIADEQQRPKPDDGRLLAMARLKIAFVQDNRRLEAAALERDEPYQEARKRYQAAAQKVRDFESAKMLAIATDESLVSLRRQVAAARIEKLTASAYYDTSVDAANAAISYAYDYRGIDRYHGYGNGYTPYTTTGYGGYYGFGVGYGYRGGGRVIR